MMRPIVPLVITTSLTATCGVPFGVTSSVGSASTR